MTATQEPTGTADAPQRAGHRYGDWLFAVAFSLLISHELDAMLRAEWLLFPGLDRLDEQTAADVFNLLHVPLFAPLLWLLTSDRASMRQRTMVGIELFIIAHAVAHTVFRGNADYRFEAPVETITVYGAAVVAALHLFVRTRSRA